MSLYFITWLFTLLILLTFTWFAIRVMVITFEKDSVSYIQRISAFTLLWVVYLVTLSSTGIIHDFELPPKMPLFVVLPALFIITFLLTRPATGKLLENAPLHLLIGFQSFRIIVELIIWLAFRNDLIPLEATFEGYNYDILVGITAIPIAFYAYKGKVSRGILMFWNVAGLIILANTVRVFVLSAFFPDLIGAESSSVDVLFVTPPLLFIAGIYMPLAVLLHGMTIKKLIAK